MEHKIIEVLANNHFGVTFGYGRRLRIRNYSKDKFRIEGGIMGAKYSKEHGLVVWNLGARNSMPEISVSELNKIEREIKNILDH